MRNRRAQRAAQNRLLRERTAMPQSKTLDELMERVPNEPLNYLIGLFALPRASPMTSALNG